MVVVLLFVVEVVVAHLKRRKPGFAHPKEMQRRQMRQGSSSLWSRPSPPPAAGPSTRWLTSAGSGRKPARPGTDAAYALCPHRVVALGTPRSCSSCPRQCLCPAFPLRTDAACPPASVSTATPSPRIPTAFVMSVFVSMSVSMFSCSSCLRQCLCPCVPTAIASTAMLFSLRPSHSERAAGGQGKKGGADEMTRVRLMR